MGEGDGHHVSGPALTGHKGKQTEWPLIPGTLIPASSFFSLGDILGRGGLGGHVTHLGRKAEF